jgi:glycosyltransferase involved in cell wall biosynthesis
MDACARELQSFLNCELDIFCFSEGTDAPFQRELFFKYPCSVTNMTGSEDNIPELRQYNFLIICGWHVKAYRRAAIACRGKAMRVLCMDNQWLATPKQLLGIAVFRSYLFRLFDYAFVPGLRQAQFASYLGFRASKIIIGHYSCAPEFFRDDISDKTTPTKSFLFVGRLTEEKNVNVLVRAWRVFNNRAKTDWKLIVCGTGPLSSEFDQLNNVELLGFVQPIELPNIMRRASALVLPSRREPWGVVIHEAAASGLGLIVTEPCGAADYYLRNRLNGFRVPADNVPALADALEEFSKLDNSTISSFGAKSRILASQRTTSTWVSAVTIAME